MNGRLLIHVEDPGAANWVVALVPELETAGVDVDIVCEPDIAGYLAARGVTADMLEADISAEDILAAAKPAGLLVGTSENLESRALALIDGARTMGIPTAAFVDQGGNAEHRFRGCTRNPLAHAPDLLFVPDRESADAFEALGFGRAKLLVSGNPHLDRARRVARQLSREGRDAVRARVVPDAPAGRPLVVFVGEIGYVVNPEAEQWEAELSFAGRDGTSPRALRVLEEVIDALAEVKPQSWLVLRLHPKNTRADFTGCIEEVDAVSEGGDPLELLWAADLVVGMSSSPLEEAAAMGRPVLSALPHPVERGWLPGLASGAIPVVESRDALRTTLAAMLRGEGAVQSGSIPSPAAPKIVAKLNAWMSAA